MRIKFDVRASTAVEASVRAAKDTRVGEVQSADVVSVTFKNPGSPPRWTVVLDVKV